MNLSEKLRSVRSIKNKKINYLMNKKGEYIIKISSGVKAVDAISFLPNNNYMIDVSANPKSGIPILNFIRSNVTILSPNVSFKHLIINNPEGKVLLDYEITSNNQNRNAFTVLETNVKSKVLEIKGYEGSNFQKINFEGDEMIISRCNFKSFKGFSKKKPFKKLSIKDTQIKSAQTIALQGTITKLKNSEISCPKLHINSKKGKMVIIEDSWLQALGEMAITSNDLRVISSGFRAENIVLKSTDTSINNFTSEARKLQLIMAKHSLNAKKSKLHSGEIMFLETSLSKFENTDLIADNTFFVSAASTELSISTIKAPQANIEVMDKLGLKNNSYINVPEENLYITTPSYERDYTCEPAFELGLSQNISEIISNEESQIKELVKTKRY